MPFAAAHSRSPDTREAVRDVTQRVHETLQGETPSLSFLFVSHHHESHFKQIPGWAHEMVGGALLGCSAESVAGGNEEIERCPAVSLWSAVLPGARVETFAATFERTPDGIACNGLPAFDRTREPGSRTAFVLGEPFSCSPHSLVAWLKEDAPGTPLLGGMASGGTAPGVNRLFLNGESIAEGVVGAVIEDGPRIRSIVSQGCRPVGKHYVVTRAERNIVYELGGIPAVQRLDELLRELSPEDQELVRHGLFLGLAMNEYRDKFERGDFLVANILGADPDEGSIRLANIPRVGQTVQFQVRDAQTAHEDLVELLGDGGSNVKPSGALLFTCNGRGLRLFPEAHHDAATIQKLLGPIPLAGFFAQGELGPVGGRNYLHGYTASIALFE